jgi:hypothetical protein
VRTRKEPVVPAAARIELTDEVEQPRGGRVEVRGELGDLVADPVELDDVRMSRNEARTTDVHRRASCAAPTLTPDFRAACAT